MRPSSVTQRNRLGQSDPGSNTALPHCQPPANATGRMKSLNLLIRFEAENLMGWWAGMGVFPWFPTISLVRWWIVNCNLLGNPRDKKGITLNESAGCNHKPATFATKLGEFAGQKSALPKHGNCICEMDERGVWRAPFFSLVWNTSPFRDAFFSQGHGSYSNRGRQRDLISDLGGLDKCATKILQSSSSKQTKTFPRFRKQRRYFIKQTETKAAVVVVGCLTFET